MSNSGNFYNLAGVKLPKVMTYSILKLHEGNKKRSLMLNGPLLIHARTHHHHIQELKGCQVVGGDFALLSASGCKVSAEIFGLISAIKMQMGAERS